MPNFSANIIYLFNEVDLIDRIAAAAAVGFRAVECQRPYEVPPAVVRDLLEAHDMELVLINTPVHPSWPHDSGIAIYPDRTSAFREIATCAIEYAAEVGCPRLHVVAGGLNGIIDPMVAEETFLDNILWAADRGRSSGVKILIEPLNAIDNPGYFLTATAQAHGLLMRANHDNLSLQYDLYHAGMSGEDVIGGARTHLHLIDHMQVAGVPGRHEPDTGTVDMLAAFDAIDAIGYEGWIGAEYRPSHSTTESFTWGVPYGIGPKSPQPPRVKATTF